MRFAVIPKLAVSSIFAILMALPAYSTPIHYQFNTINATSMVGIYFGSAGVDSIPEIKTLVTGSPSTTCSIGGCGLFPVSISGSFDFDSSLTASEIKTYSNGGYQRVYEGAISNFQWSAFGITAPVTGDAISISNDSNMASPFAVGDYISIGAGVQSGSVVLDGFTLKSINMSFRKDSSAILDDNLPQTLDQFLFSFDMVFLNELNKAIIVQIYDGSGIDFIKAPDGRILAALPRPGIALTQVSEVPVPGAFILFFSAIALVAGLKRKLLNQLFV